MHCHISHSPAKMDMGPLDLSSIKEQFLISLDFFTMDFRVVALGQKGLHQLLGCFSFSLQIFVAGVVVHLLVVYRCIRIEWCPYFWCNGLHVCFFFFFFSSPFLQEKKKKSIGVKCSVTLLTAGRRTKQKISRTERGNLEDNQTSRWNDFKNGHTICMAKQMHSLERDSGTLWQSLLHLRSEMY